MSVPCLSAALARSPIADRVSAGVHMFSVQRGGVFGGRRYQAGEIVLIAGVPADGDQVVMVPAGPGRPQFGSVDGVALRGGFGEPCSLARWGVCGSVQGVARTAGASWTIEWFSSDLVELAPQRRIERDQLCLFAA